MSRSHEQACSHSRGCQSTLKTCLQKLHSVQPYMFYERGYGKYLCYMCNALFSQLRYECIFCDLIFIY